MLTNSQVFGNLLVRKRKHLPFILYRDIPFKIDQNKNQNRAVDKVQNLGNERQDICKGSCHDSGHSNSP